MSTRTESASTSRAGSSILALNLDRSAGFNPTELELDGNTLTLEAILDTALRDAVLLEMGLWVKDGATTWQTLLAATKYAAEVCGIGDDLGTIEVGKLADLIVVRNNPLDDVNHLRELELVFKAGQLVADHRPVKERV